MFDKILNLLELNKKFERIPNVVDLNIISEKKADYMYKIFENQSFFELFFIVTQIDLLTK